ncbi:ankyrin repeat protein [Citrus sinensis]|nr:ankyrin repeat protein [Citrus sinensis]
MVAKMQEVAGERGGYLHGRGALDSDDLLYLKEQMEAEEDAERLLRHSSPASVPLPLRVEPKPRSGIRQQDLLKKVLEVKPKKPRVSTPSDGNQPKAISSNSAANNIKPEVDQVKKKEQTTSKSDKPGGQNEVEKPVKSLLGLAYASSDDED